ncbi:MAG: hypothetical protein KOO61_01975 [Spirochaetales bacterium]|nr:hypothetical protein [Spirochaetales bacterium]
MEERAADCLKCIHFKVTWESAFPRACTIFGVKSKRMPSVVVFESTGRHCPAFQRSPKIKERPRED